MAGKGEEVKIDVNNPPTTKEELLLSHGVFFGGKVANETYSIVDVSDAVVDAMALRSVTANEKVEKLRSKPDDAEGAPRNTPEQGDSSRGGARGQEYYYIIVHPFDSKTSFFTANRGISYCDLKHEAKRFFFQLTKRSFIVSCAADRMMKGLRRLYAWFTDDPNEKPPDSPTAGPDGRTLIHPDGRSARYTNSAIARVQEQDREEKASTNYSAFELGISDRDEYCVVRGQPENQHWPEICEAAHLLPKTKRLRSILKVIGVFPDDVRIGIFLSLPLHRILDEYGLLFNIEKNGVVEEVRVLLSENMKMNQPWTDDIKIRVTFSDAGKKRAEGLEVLKTHDGSEIDGMELIFSKYSLNSVPYVVFRGHILLRNLYFETHVVCGECGMWKAKVRKTKHLCSTRTKKKKCHPVNYMCPGFAKAAGKLFRGDILFDVAVNMINEPENLPVPNGGCSPLVTPPAPRDSIGVDSDDAYDEDDGEDDVDDYKPGSNPGSSVFSEFSSSE